MKPAPAFAAEADLCAAFIAAATRGGEWMAYPETAGFDIVLVRRADGVQIGVEAKLRLNAHVVAQAYRGLDASRHAEGPDYRAAVIPMGAKVEGVGTLADAIGITVIEVSRDGVYGRHHGGGFLPALPTGQHPFDDRGWHQWCPTRRLALPAFVPDVAAGASSPVQLTDWKIRALRLVALLEVRGFIHRSDFVALELSAQRWTDKWTGWLESTPQGYVAGGRMPDFKAQHPKVFAELVATIEEWQPKSKAPPAYQPTLLGAG